MAKPPSTQTPAKMLASMYEVLAGRRWSDRRMLPIDSRSSFAGRRDPPASSGRSVSSGSDDLVAVCLERSPASPGHGFSGAGSSDVVVPAGSFSSCTWRAAWIADSAASVGSLIFFGVLAMSVVASLLRWTTITAESSAAPGARDHRDPHRIPHPAGRPKKGPQTLNFPCRTLKTYRLGRANETAP